MHELATLKDAHLSTNTPTMAISYVLAAGLMFGYLIMRENDLRKKSTPEPLSQSGPSILRLVYVHTAYWSVPILITAAIGGFITWVLKTETDDANHTIVTFI